MVSPTCFPVEDFRKYPPARIPAYYAYPTYEKRYSFADSTVAMDDRDDGSQQRKRIAVACGRCRKRKIRCSGDNGTGQACVNCRNAGHDPCQYLRVSSQEAPMRNESFSYGLDASRQFQARGTSAVPSLPTVPFDGMQVAPPADGMPYRNGYGYGSGKVYGSDEVDYSVYPTYPPDVSYVMNNYRLGSNAAKPSSSLYVDTETATGYGYNTTASPDRVEYGGFQGMPTDRTLPMPHVRRPLPSSAPRPYRAGSTTSTSAYSKPSPPDASPSPRGDSGYSFDTSPATPYTAGSGMSRSSDMYTTSVPSDTLMHGTEGASSRLGVSLSDYRYHDTTHPDARPPMPPMLVSGQTYVGGHASAPSYMPLEMSEKIEAEAARK